MSSSPSLDLTPQAARGPRTGAVCVGLAFAVAAGLNFLVPTSQLTTLQIVVAIYLALNGLLLIAAVLAPRSFIGSLLRPLLVAAFIFATAVVIGLARVLVLSFLHSDGMSLFLSGLLVPSILVGALSLFVWRRLGLAQSTSPGAPGRSPSEA